MINRRRPRGVRSSARQRFDNNDRPHGYKPFSIIRSRTFQGASAESSVQAQAKGILVHGPLVATVLRHHCDVWELYTVYLFVRTTNVLGYIRYKKRIRSNRSNPTTYRTSRRLRERTGEKTRSRFSKHNCQFF